MKNQITFVIILLGAMCINGKQTFAQFDTVNFHVIKQQLESMEHDIEAESGTPAWEESELQRWFRFYEPRVGAAGNFSPMVQATRDYYNNRYQVDRSAPAALSSPCYSVVSDWKPFDFSRFSNSGSGVGKIECIRISPSNPNVIYAGATRGGLWKTTDGGNNWSNMNTDNLPVLSIADIAIDPVNPNIIYISTGTSVGLPSWSYAHSVGIFKSVDGGQTWNTTGLKHGGNIEYCQNNNGNPVGFDLQIGNWNTQITRLLIHPNEPNTILAAVNYFVYWSDCNDRKTWGGIFKSTDGGESWRCVHAGFMYDMEFKPANPDVIYASGKEIFKSTDKGETWSAIPGYNVYVNTDCYPVTSDIGTCDWETEGFWDHQASRIVIAVTPAAPDKLYILGNKVTKGTSTTVKKFWMYDDNANSLTEKKASGIGNASLDPHIDLDVSPVNPNVIYVGGVYFIKSVNGGASFFSTHNSSGIHADINDINVVPGTNTVYAAHDGGVSINTNEGAIHLV